MVNEDQSALVVTVLVLVVAAGALLISGLDGDVPGRGLLALLSLMTVPGIPLGLALPISERPVQLVAGTALGMAVLLLVSVAQLLTGTWSPVGAQLILLAIGLAATFFIIRPRVLG
jgi:hypothetical protein